MVQYKKSKGQQIKGQINNDMIFKGKTLDDEWENEETDKTNGSKTNWLGVLDNNEDEDSKSLNKRY